MDSGELCGLAPERALPEGWRTPSASHRQVKAAETQLRQGADLNQLREFLLELFECLELDYDICEVSCQLLNVASMTCPYGDCWVAAVKQDHLLYAVSSTCCMLCQAYVP